MTDGGTADGDTADGDTADGDTTDGDTTDGDTDAGRDVIVICVWCGTAPPGNEAPAEWTVQSSDRGVQWMCRDCTRANLRSIEARLDETWW